MSKFAKRVDNNHQLCFQTAIRWCLKHNSRAIDLSSVGKGISDFMVIIPTNSSATDLEQILFFEVKNPAQYWKLTPAEELFMLTLPANFYIVENEKQVTDILNWVFKDNSSYYAYSGVCLINTLEVLKKSKQEEPFATINWRVFSEVNRTLKEGI